jgi:fibronectin-binding autotransporter adhesin
MSFFHAKKMPGILPCIVGLSALLLVGAMAMNANAATSNWIVPVADAASSGNWSAVTTAVPGWDTGAMPNAIGDVAQLTMPTGMTGYNKAVVTTQDTVGGVTVGAINLGANNDLGAFWWQITATNGITLNNGGLGATISNTNQNTTGSELYITGGTLTLADNLRIVSTSQGANVDGPIAITSVLAGTANITVNNSTPFDIATNKGQIAITGVNSSLTGTISVEKGLLMPNRYTALGNKAANTINLGLANADSAAVIFTRNETNIIPNNVVVPAGNTGTLTLGSVYAQTYSGTITLGSNLNLYNRLNTTGSGGSTPGNGFSGKISGAGGITKVGPGTTWVTYAGNDYTGDTVVSAGRLILWNGSAIPDGAGKGNVIVNSGAIFSFYSGETINGLSGAGVVTSERADRYLNVGANDASSTFSGGFNMNPFNSAYRPNFQKFGLGTLTLTGTSTTTGTAIVVAGTLALSGAGSISSMALIDVQQGATFDVSNVTGAQWTLAGTQTLKGTGTVIGSIVGANNSVVSPGESPGVLTIIGSMDMSAGANMNWELAALKDDATPGLPGTDYDLTTVSNALTLGGTSKLTLSLGTNVPSADPFWSSSHSWKVIDVGPSGATSGNFAVLADGGPYTQGAFSTSVDGGGDVYLNFTAVPEPGTIVMLLLAGLAFAAYRRRAH